ncbi:teichoic acid biosynthesis protein C [Streptomyces sp. NPDC047197]|uniref:phage baseplate protein n=1 Tax=Streptomyces sp. NPDC047197 TaxID=3155477 RepID=UPI003403C615
MTETGRVRYPTRRSLLGLGAAGAGVTLIGGQAFAAVGAVPQRQAELRWSEPGKVWLRGVRLHHSTVLQSFAFDERNRQIYALQVIPSGRRLPGESRTYSHDERVRNGDLCLNRLAMDGTRLDHMYLKGFGHGTTVAIERAPSGGTALWTEWDAQPSSGYGRGVCRFRYTAGKVLTGNSAGLDTFRPQPGSINNNAALDTAHGRLLLRYRRSRLPRYALYDLARFAARDFRPLADFPQPGAESGLPFQGMALHGAYAYQLLGSAYGPDNPREGGGNTRLFRIGMPDGRYVSEKLDRTDPELGRREPEGLAVRTGRNGGLYMGFAHGPAGGRRLSLYRKTL